MGSPHLVRKSSADEMRGPRRQGFVLLSGPIVDSLFAPEKSYEPEACFTWADSPARAESRSRLSKNLSKKR